MHAQVVAFVATLGAAVLPQVSARPPSCGPSHTPGKALYLINNEPKNAVVALQIGSDGLLHGGTSTATGGAGSNSISGATNQPAAPDALVSQSSVTVAGDYLFAVNAGSNTVTMFAINPKNPTQLTVVGKPVDVLGEFPNTVAASVKHNLVCVGSTGAKAGISCAPFTGHGIGAMDGLRAIDLKQSTPPVGPTNTVSQVFFSDDETTLFATVKGDPTKNNTGFLAAFPTTADHGESVLVAQQGVDSSPEGTAVLFGSFPVPGTTDIFVTDASFGGAVLSVDPKTKVATLKGKAVVQDQKAICWSAISPATKTAFVADVAINRLIEMSLTDASIQGTVDLSANGDPGLIDLLAAGKFIYALSPGNGTTEAFVTAVDTVAKKQVQHAALKSLGAGKNSQGLAIYM